RVLARLFEPRVLVRRVVDDEVDEHTYAALLRSMGKFDKIANRAVTRIDAVIIGHVVTVIAMGRDLERHQPDGRDAETMQVVETSHQTLDAFGARSGSRQFKGIECLTPASYADEETRWGLAMSMYVRLLGIAAVVFGFGMSEALPASD